MSAALLSAMVSCRAHRNSAAWRALDGVVRAAAQGHAELRRLWEEAGGADDPLPLLPQLCTTLAATAAADASCGERLGNWLRQYAERLPFDNSITGNVRLDGPVVQAGQILGGVHVHPAAPSETTVPRQLPPPPAYLAGRAEDLRALDALCPPEAAPSVRLVVVTGFAGVGKTALVSRWLSERAADFPDGQLYTDLGAHAPSGPRTPGEVLEHFLRSLGASSIPSDTAERVLLWRSLTSGRRLALMVDNAVSAAHVRPLLPAGAGSLVAVTSRSHLSGLLVEGAVLHRLGALPVEASVELLSHRGGGDRVEQDPHSAQEVVRLCACLPLALCLAAAQLAVHPLRSLAALVSRLSEGQGPLDGLRADGEAAVRSALDESYRLLPGAVAPVYRRMGLLPSSTYDADLVAAVVALPRSEADRALETLIETNLLEETEPGLYRFHDLVRPHARQRGVDEDGPALREETLRRFVDWCLTRATAAEELLTPSHRTLARTVRHPPPDGVDFRDASEALAWLGAHQSHLQAAVRHCADAGWHAACWQLVDAMWPVFLRLRPAEWWVEAHRLGLAAARDAEDRAGVARMLTSGGAGLRNAGLHQEAAEWYDRALRHAAEDGDVRQQAQALQGLANAHLALGRLTEAASHFSRSLALREEIGYRRGAALSRLGLGQVALDRAEPERAMAWLSRAHADLLAENDAYDAARVSAYLGVAAVRLGDRAAGLARLRDAVAQFESLGSRHWQARSLEMLGEAARQCGDLAEARRCYQRAADILRLISPSDAQRLEGRLPEC